ncbi:hypothetical protein TorRG33x02_341520 [Trema orientale]|uniref:Uncharacterized protein n=1 Tax=Trema orientale TaxID=63057 RepID=A0A2P5ATV6_TREOI|nr:hypothetical protein TorRG33x02_341520 [Trema orientale]
MNARKAKNLISKIERSDGILLDSEDSIIEEVVSFFQNLYKSDHGSGMGEFQKHFHYKVGNGLKVRFWEDVWAGDCTLANRFPFLYRLAASKNASVSFLRAPENFIRIGGFSWNLGFLRNLNERELEHVSSLIAILDLSTCHVDDDDKRVWHLDDSGQFTYKSLFLKRAHEGDPFPLLLVNLEFCLPYESQSLQLVSYLRHNTNEVLQRCKPLSYLLPN